MSPQLSRLRRVAYVAFFSVIVGFFVITGVRLQNLAFPEARGFLFSDGLGRHRHRSGFGQRRLALVSLKHFEMLWRVRTSFGFVHCGFHGFRGPIEHGANAS